MRRITIINQKGGVGKTTTAVNVGMALARLGQRVLLIDLDPQAHLTMHLGLDPADDTPGTYEMLTASATIAKVRRKVSDNLWVVGSSIDLAAAEIELVSVVGREVILRDALDQHLGQDNKNHRQKYDYILIDCPPSLGVLTLNGLCAAHEVFIPLQPHYLALQGLGKLVETVLLVTKRINPSLKVSGVMVCMHDTGTRLAAEVIEDVRSFFEKARGTNVPWASAQLFETLIRRNIKLAEAPSHGKTIFDYAPDSNGAKDYERLSLEIHDPIVFHERISEPNVPAKKDDKIESEKSSNEVQTDNEIDSALAEPIKAEPAKVAADKHLKSINKTKQHRDKKQTKAPAANKEPEARPSTEPLTSTTPTPVPESTPKNVVEPPIIQSV
ncbi:MAG: ParA family protein [Planctomycetota bacterium]|nr:MAG: ParA family protein [Planctomycetota bacterium]